MNMDVRKPLALANWKMAMTVSESLDYAHDFAQYVGDLSRRIIIILCPPYTALYPISMTLMHTSIQLGAQDLCPESDLAHTGEISTSLLADVGCGWVMVGHWEVRRRLGENDQDVNRKMHACFKADLRPILLLGEGINERDHFREALQSRLSTHFEGCSPGHIARMAFVYEPEWTIGADEPAPPEHIAEACAFIRDWIRKSYGEEAAEGFLIIYGGSVTPTHARDLLASVDVDGLGAGRKGRDPVAFAEIVQMIAKTKGLE
jgi:triosephosphate isomerase